MSFKRYPKAIVTIDGVSQVELTNVSVDFDPQLNEVITFEGLAGFSEGAKRIAVTAETTVPRGGPEFNFPNAMANMELHDVAFAIGGETWATNGFFTQGNISYAAAGTASGSWTFIGEYVESV